MKKLLLSLALLIAGIAAWGQPAYKFPAKTPIYGGDLLLGSDSATHRTSNFKVSDLGDKIVNSNLEAGTDISLTQKTGGGLIINSTATVGSSSKLRVTANDALNDYLWPKVSVANGLVNSIINPSGNEVVNFAINTGVMHVVSTLSDLDGLIAGADSGRWVIIGNIDLAAGTKTIPSNVILVLNGGKLSNGIIVCDETFIEGSGGLDKTIELNGTVAGDIVNFDWFDNEKSTLADYNTFINANDAAFGAIPSISDANRLIYKMLVDNSYTVQFGQGIYPFDDEIEVGNNTFYIMGEGRENTLLWLPQSNFLHYITGGALYPYIRNITIEAWGNVLLTDAHAVNGIHAPRLSNSVFISYSDHTFYNDATIPGGTGCPIYGGEFNNLSLHSGTDKGFFTGYGSGSNIYDNVVDMHKYFGDIYNTSAKNFPYAIFYNSSVKNYLNSNIVYAGLRYVFYANKVGTSFKFFASKNIFESGGGAYYAICKVENTLTFSLSVEDNGYIGTPTENGYHYILDCPVTKVYNCDSPTFLKTPNVKNYASYPIRSVTYPIDGGGTEYRLCVDAPFSAEGEDFASQDVAVLNQDVADFYGFGDLYAAYPDSVSFIRITDTLRPYTSQLPSLARMLGSVNYDAMYRHPSLLNKISFVEDGDLYDVVSTNQDVALVLTSYEDYIYYYSLNLTNITYIVSDTINLDGNIIFIRSGTTFQCMGGSINNGTINSDQTTKFIDWRGTAIRVLSIDHGATVNRPTADLYVGKMYFDTNLGYPVWWNGTIWIEELSAVASLDFGSIAAHTTIELTITVIGVSEDDTWNIYATPRNGIESGLIWSAYVSAANTVTIRLANVTTGAINPVSGNWKVTANEI